MKHGEVKQDACGIAMNGVQSTDPMSCKAILSVTSYSILSGSNYLSKLSLWLNFMKYCKGGRENKLYVRVVKSYTYVNWDLIL